MRFDRDGVTPEDRVRLASLYFDDLLHSQVLAFNSKYKEAEGALVGELRRLNADITGNREFPLAGIGSGKRRVFVSAMVLVSEFRNRHF